METTVNKVIDQLNLLSLEDEEYILELAQKQIIEKKREKIYKRSKETNQNLKKGAYKKGNFKNFFEDMENV